MRKLSLVIIFLIIISLLVSCAGAVENTSAESSANTSSEGVSSEAAESSVASSKEESSKVKNESSEVKVDMKTYNVRNFGAKANGQDDSPYIQAAIDKCAADGGGVVLLPAGSYTISNTIYKKAAVSIVGDSMWATRLVWNGSDNSAMINTANEALWGTSIENIFFLKAKGDKIVGILGGSTLQNYNSAIGTFKNLVFFGLYCGIDGSAEPNGVGIFDCMFENIFCSDCTYGLHLYGSGNTIIHPRIATCKAGLVLDYLNGESFDGVHVIGGVFASNTTDMLIPSKNGTRPCNFVGTWFENAAQGIINITNPGTRIMNITFRDCMLNSAADNKNYFLFDTSNAYGTVTLDSCTVVNNDGIKAPTDKNSILAITNLQVLDRTGNYIINDRNSGHFTSAGGKTVYVIKHNLKMAPTSVSVTPSTPETAKGGYYVTVDETQITITFLTAPAGEIGFYWEVSRR